MGWWSRRKASRTLAGAAVSDRHASRADLEHLRDFVRTRTGVEAYVEPATSVTQMTIALVAGDGEWTRRRIASAKAAADFARTMQIPVYDTNRVGYPRRMRDYDQRRKQTERELLAPVSTVSPREQAAIMTLEVIAGTDPLPDDHSRDDVVRLWREARSKAHPDRAGGQRDQWDKVEDAARVLGLG